MNTKCYRTNEEKFQKEPTGKYQTKILVDEGDCDFYYIDPEDDFSYEGSDGRIEFVKLENSEKYKVVFPKAGTVRDKPLTTRILLPGEIFTDKFLCILCDTQEEALNAEKYFNSTFYRAGLDSKMTSWNLYRKWHSNLPLPDFHTGQEIDWKASPDVYNKQLAALLGFSEDEWKKIDNYIK